MIMIVDDPIEPGEKVGKEKYLNWIAGLKFHREINKYGWWFSPWYVFSPDIEKLPLEVRT